MTNRHIDVLTAGRRVAAAALRRPLPVALGVALLAPAVLGAWTPGPGTTRGGEVRNELRLSVSTNTSADTAVRLRAGEPATRTYHLSNHAEYPLGGVLLNDPQLPGGRLSCGSDRSIPPGGAIDCTATFTAAPGPQSARVSAVADAPNHLPQSHADAPTGYLGITAGIRLARVGAPAGTGLSRRSAPRAVPTGVPVPSEPAAAPGTPGIPGAPGAGFVAASAPEPAAESAVDAPARSTVRALAAVGGTVELQYRLEAFGDVPITAASITEGLPGLGAVNCAGPDGGHTLTPGQAVDCHATGTARPGRQTGTARADGLADDATVGPDGSRQGPRRVSAEAEGVYDGLQPIPPSPEPAEPTTAGAGTGSGTGAGSTSGFAPGSGPGAGSGAGAGPGSATGTGTGPGAGTGPGTAGAAGTGGAGGVGGTGGAGGAGGVGTPPGFSGDALPPGLFPVAVPAGSQPAAAALGPQPGNAAQAQPGNAAQAQPVAGAAALAGQMLGPFLPGRAPALLPGGTAVALPASPFAAPGSVGPATPFAGNPGGAAAGSQGTAGPAPGSSSGSSPGPGRTPGQGASPTVGSQQPGAGAGRSPGSQKQDQYATEDWPPGEEDDPWDSDEVMMLLLAILLPVLCVLAAAFTVRNRGRR